MARGSWVRVRRLVAGDNRGAASEDLRRILAAGTPDPLRPDIAVQATLSSKPSADTPGTLYMNWLSEPCAPDELVEDIYMHTLTLAIFAAIQTAPRARVTWPQDKEIAAPVLTAAAPPKGGVQ